MKAEDEDDSSLTYTLLTTGDNLGKDGTATKSSVITQAGGKTLTANIYGDEFGFNMAEIEAARNVGDTLKGGAISAGASLTKKGLDQAAIQLAIKGAVKTGNKLLRWIPIVGTGKTIYGLYGSGKNAGDILANVGYSANWKEAMYNSLNLGAEGLRFTAGAFDLVVGEVPLIGQLSDLTQDAIDVGLGAGQVYLKSKALEARSLSAEGKESVGVVTVVVEDGDGYKDKYVYVYAEKYYYVGWDAE